MTVTDDALRAQVLAETGDESAWAPAAFDDLDTDVRPSIARVQAEPAIPQKINIWGRVGDNTNGTLREVLGQPGTS